jgi:hypothetical protein
VLVNPGNVLQANMVSPFETELGQAAYLLVSAGSPFLQCLV